ncbi:MAG: molybdopterin-dependent oxidoreductase [Bacillota bacterium]
MTRRLIVPLAAILVVTLLLFGCAPRETEDTPEAQAGDEDAITVVCERSGETEITIAELKQMRAITADIVRETDDGTEEYEIRGALLDGVLDLVGEKIEDLDGIRFVAGDGYAVNVPGEIVAGRDIIFAYEIDGEPLREGTRPIRVFIPDEESMYWVKNVVEIELLYPEETVEINQIVFLETRFSELETVEYEDGDLAVRTGELVALIPPAESVSMTAADGFNKTEEYDTFIDAFMKVTGPDAPAFRSPDLPAGMHVRDLVWLSCGDTAFFSVTRGSEILDSASAGDHQGVSLAHLAEQLGLLEAESYILEAVDGYEVEVTREDLALGIVYLRDDGQVASAFEDLPKNTSVKGLLLLKVAE